MTVSPNAFEAWRERYCHYPGEQWHPRCKALVQGDPPMTIYEALSKDHREFERLLERLLQASNADNDNWKGILDELRRGVIAHAHAEEAVLYNALREADQAKGLVAHSYAEHAMAETEMRALGA